MEDCPKCGRTIRVSRGGMEYPSNDREDVACPYPDCRHVIRVVKTSMGIETSTPDQPDPEEVERQRQAAQAPRPPSYAKLPLLDD